MSKQLTSEDAIVVLEFNKSFDMSMSKEDKETLEELSKVKGNLSDEQIQVFKRITLNQLVSGQGTLADPLFDAPRELAKKMADLILQECRKEERLADMDKEDG